MFNLDVRVLENPSNPFKRVRSRDTGQRYFCIQDEEVNPRFQADKGSGCDETDDGNGVKRHAPRRCLKLTLREPRLSNIEHE